MSQASRAKILGVSKAALYSFIASRKIMVIEDTPHGLKAAKNAGMFVIASTTTYRKNDLKAADLIVDNFLSREHLV